jgi:mono/diheme cytochrome c family protein
MKALATLILVFAALVGCTEPPPESAAEGAERVRTVPIPPELAAGEATFNANCAPCHGERALGTSRGPPFIDVIYESSHHGDLAFIMAAQRGVQQHHWTFGDMPPLPNVTFEQVQSIIGYVRFLQHQAGIN